MNTEPSEDDSTCNNCAGTGEGRGPYACGECGGSGMRRPVDDRDEGDFYGDDDGVVWDGP